MAAAESSSPLSSAAEPRGSLWEAAQEVVRASAHFPELEDFHYYHSFASFKTRVGTLRQRLRRVLQTFSNAPFPEDTEEASEWAVDLHDQFLECVDLSLDAYKNQNVEPGFPKAGGLSLDSSAHPVGVVRTKLDEEHPSILSPKPGRPQDAFERPVDNSNTPFNPPPPDWLAAICQGNGKKNADVNRSPTPSNSLSSKASVNAYARKLGIGKVGGNPTIPLREHPFEDVLKNLEYQPWQLEESNPIMPSELKQSPINFVETTSQLLELAQLLENEREFAVDLEEHSYHSFQGFLCLMQISTRQKDFIIDVLKLRSKIGPLLGPIFANPLILKVLHGADHDVLWLQRDFNIYIVNMFDTGQASRVLGMDRYGLAFLLKHYCNVKTNKKFQLADWRIRPLSKEMLKYAQCDTHYLLYIFDRMMNELINLDNQTTLEISPLAEVYKRSRDICLKLYEKELFHDNSYRRLLNGYSKTLSPQQTAVLARLYAWRDETARNSDESVGYVLPRNLMYRLAESMPENPKRLRSIVKNSSACVIRHSSYILELISSTKQQFLIDSVLSQVEEEKDGTKGQVDNTQQVQELERNVMVNVEKTKESTLVRMIETVSKSDELNLVSEDDENSPKIRVKEEGEKKFVQESSRNQDMVHIEKSSEVEVGDEKAEEMGNSKEKTLVNDKEEFQRNDIVSVSDSLIIEATVLKVKDEEFETKEAEMKDVSTENEEKTDEHGKEKTGKTEAFGSTMEIDEPEETEHEMEEVKREGRKTKDTPIENDGSNFMYQDEQKTDMKLVSISVKTKKRIRKGGLGDMLGSNAKKKSKANEEITQKIKSSLSVPFLFPLPEPISHPPFQSIPIPVSNTDSSKEKKENDFDSKVNGESNDNKSFGEKWVEMENQHEVSAERVKTGNDLRIEVASHQGEGERVGMAKTIHDPLSPSLFSSVRERYAKSNRTKDASNRGGSHVKFMATEKEVDDEGFVKETQESKLIQMEQNGGDLQIDEDFIPFDYAGFEMTENELGKGDNRMMIEETPGVEKESKRSKRNAKGKAQGTEKRHKNQFTGLEGILDDGEWRRSKPSKSQVYPKSGNRSATFV